MNGGAVTPKIILSPDLILSTDHWQSSRQHQARYLLAITVGQTRYHWLGYVSKNERGDDSKAVACSTKCLEHFGVLIFASHPDATVT